MQKLITIALIALVSIPAYAQQSASTIDELLDNVQQGKPTDDNQQRENEFRQKRDQQEEMLAEAETAHANEENRSETLEAIFNANEVVNNELQDTLNERLGALKELFGVMQQVAGDARTRFDNSITNVQYPERTVFLEDLAKKIGSNSKLPSRDEIETLWFMLQQEMTESGKVVKFTADVIDTNGAKVPTEVVRVGLFNIVADGKYLKYDPVSGALRERQIQPRSIHRRTTKNFFKANKFFSSRTEEEMVPFGISLENVIEEVSDLSAATKELFFKCDHSRQGDGLTIDTITVNTNTMKGTWMTNQKRTMNVMSFTLGTTILNTTIAMTPDLMVITTPNFIMGRGFYTYAINRETLAYSDSTTTLGKCSIIDKNNKF